VNCTPIDTGGFLLCSDCPYQTCGQSAPKASHHISSVESAAAVGQRTFFNVAAFLKARNNMLRVCKCQLRRTQHAMKLHSNDCKLCMQFPSRRPTKLSRLACFVNVARINRSCRDVAIDLSVILKCVTAKFRVLDHYCALSEDVTSSKQTLLGFRLGHKPVIELDKRLEIRQLLFGSKLRFK
jgi:hypothetical protein